YPRENQPYPPRDGQQHYQPRDQQQQYGREHQQRPPHQGGESRGDDTDRLPSFITGGGGQPQQQQSYQQNGYENQPDRFPLHRRRRRHRGPRGDMPSSQQGDDSPLPRPPQQYFLRAPGRYSPSRAKGGPPAPEPAVFSPGQPKG